MEFIEDIIKRSINIDNDIAIFDVDRTIINTTSWYHACMTEDLLLSKENIKKFKYMNDVTFQNPTQQNLKDFRVNTLNLIEPKIDDKFIEKIKSVSDCYWQSGDYTNIWRLYQAGKYTAFYLVKIYDDAIKYIEFLSKYYGNNLKIIFLTSGYEKFIRGVVDGILEKYNIKYLNYLVIGSQLKFQNGVVIEDYHLSQFEKQKVVEYIISMGGKIRFLADDSNENEELFKIVERENGIALNIKHIPNSLINETWENYLKSLTFENIKENLKKDNSCIGLNEVNIEMPDFLQELSNCTNEIGITNVSIDEFNFCLKKLKQKMKMENDRVDFEKYIQKMIYKKDEKIYLRGKLYYNWLPQYIFIDDRCIIERWKELYKVSKKCLEIINKNNLLKFAMNFGEKLIIYTIIDHFLESMLFILNLVEQNDLANNCLIKKITHRKILDIIQEVMNYIYMYFYDDDRCISALNSIINNLNELNIIEKIPNNVQIYKTMRELDDNVTIFKFVKSISEKLQNKNINLDYIISFPYGGITLGFAMKSYMKIILKQDKLPELLNCHYSSKQKMRADRIEKDIDFSIFKYIPSVYNDFSYDMANGKKSIMILDNNVTTFKTLDLAKNFLQQIGNTVYASVAEINYDNIANHLLDNPIEELIPNWRNVLNFNAIGEYITSFNTWNTSQKSEILNDIYYSKSIPKLQINLPELTNKNYLFKICRVHNIVDLKTIMKNGANMIGIHAVYPDRIKYLNNEKKYHPLEYNLEFKEELPIALLELDSIRDMQKYIPSSVKQAILFERPIKLEDMIETCELYRIPKENMYIQLQHRTDANYIKNIKNNLCKRIIATIGLFQKDFKDYFWKLHNVLDEKNDFILLDLSKHQPDLINYSESYKESLDRVAMLNDFSKYIKHNSVPIIIADDTTPKQMKKYLNIFAENDIKVIGIDMQNTVELRSNEQQYEIVEYKQNAYQIKIRKSPNYMHEWCDFWKEEE